jgi:ribose transport system substrate-binding protein
MLRKLFNLLVVISMLTAFVPVVAAAPPAQAKGQDYIVVKDDWLSKLAEKYLGNQLSYPAIVGLTNQMAAKDSSYAKIDNPDRIEVGWKLYIPSAEEATAFMSTYKPAAAAKPKPAPGSKITIAWIPKALNNPVFELGRTGALQKAKELSAAGPYQVEVEYVGSVASDAAEQARVVEDVIAKGVDAIGISCNDPTGCEDPIKKALAAGIDVMTWDSDSPKSGRFTYLGVDNYEGGKAAAGLLVKAMGTKGKVALLTGVPGAFNLEERIRGFKDGVKDYPDIQIVATVACNDDINQGVQVVEDTMKAHPDLSGWFFVGLWPLFAERGSMKQWEAAAKAGTLKTISFDTLPVELGFVKDGYVQGLVGQKYWGWGYDTVQMIYDKIVSGKTYDSFTNSGMDLVTSKNVDAMATAWETMDFTKPLPPPE